MHYYQFNIADYRKDTGHLTLLEHGIYRNLLDSYYLNEKPLCVNDADLMRTHCVRTEEEKNAFKNVLADFFKKTKKGYTHKNCDSQISKYNEKSEKARLSAKARWDAKAMRTHSEGNANHKPITKNHKPITNVIDYSVFLNFSDGQLSELKRIRKKNKGGSITQRVANALAKEFNQAELKGFTIDQSLTEWEVRGWKSFKSDWMKVESNKPRVFSKVTEQNIINTQGWADE